LAVSVSAIGASASAAGSSKLVGIALPTKSGERWVADGKYMNQEFTKAGYKVDMQYAEDVVENQVAQIENMITKGAKVLVIGAIDGEALAPVLEKAAKAKIKVIAYDRLIRKSKNVDYYATFDNFKVGVLQGQYIEKKLNLKSAKGPFNIELFAGSPDDNNATFFFNGAMSVLNPYIKSGKLVVKSGQTKFAQVATLRWDGATAQARMDNLLSANYTKATVNVVLSPNDGLAQGIISSLKGVGYGTAKKPYPIITGQDAEVQGIKSIIAGQQSMTIFKDTRQLAKVAVDMVSAVIKGKTPTVNDKKTYNNGVKIVPSYLLTPTSVDKSNYKDTVIKSGYLKESQLK
jgi:putative multiple sugar transport system substrate-binding protein